MESRDLNDEIKEEIKLKAPKLESYQLYQPKSSQNYYPVEIPTPEKVYGEWFNRNDVKPMAEPKPLPPSFSESFVDAFKKNDFNLASNFIHQQDNLMVPSDEIAQPGWSPKDHPELMEGVNEANQSFVLDSQNERDMKNRQIRALEQQENDRRWQDGSMMAQLLGGAAGLAISPTSYIPAIGLVNDARMSIRLAQTIPSIAGSSASHELLEQSNRVKFDLEDYLLDTMRDTLFGTALFTGGLMVSKNLSSGQLWGVRHVMNLNNKDIDLLPVIPKEGPVTKIQAVSKSASAAEVDEAQKFADSSFAKVGLFKTPLIGDVMLKGAASINPIVRGLTSEFPTMRGFTNRIASHGIVTEGNLKGHINPDSFDDLMQALQADNRTMIWQDNAYYGERNKNAKKTNGDYATRDQYGQEVDSVLRTEEPSIHSSVNDAAAMFRQKMDKSYLEYRQAYDFPEKWLPPKTAKGYASRIYNTPLMKLERNEFLKDTGQWYKQADEFIKSEMKPIEELREQYKSQKAEHEAYIADKNRTDAEIKKSADDLMQVKKRLKNLEEKLQDDMRENHDKYHIHLEDVAALSAKEAKQLKKILKPLTQAKRAVKAHQKQLENHRFKIMAAKESALKAKTKTTVAKYNKEAAKLEKELPALEAKAHELKNARLMEEDKLQQMAQEKKIDPSFYRSIEGSKLVKFLNPNNRLKFRPLFESDFHIDNFVQGAYDSILNQTPEDIAHQVLNGLLGSRGENPNYQRTFLVPDHVISRWLNKNVAQNVAAYRNFFGRRTLVKNLFKDVTIDGGVKPLTARLLNDLNVKLNPLHEELGRLKAEKEQTKEVKAKIKDVEKQIMKLNKKFDQAKKDMEHAYSKMMGKTRGSQAMREYTSVIRNFAVATKLGNTPLYVATDLASAPLKHGFWPTIRDGLLPVLRNIGSLIKGGNGNKYIMNAAHAHMGLNHTLTVLKDRNWYGEGQPYVPWGSRIANGMEKVAHWSGNISGSNYIENFLQEVVAGIVQSKIIRYLLDHEKGKLRPQDKEKLLKVGISPEEHAEGMLKQYRAVGADGNGFGGHLAKFWEWQDKELANKFSNAVFRSTRDTLARRGMFDAPFALDDPWISTIYMFKAWTFSSLTRYLIPIMQRPDAEKLIGTMLMLSMGAMMNPLRRIAKGEDPIQEDDNMFWNAMVDGGVFSVVTDTLEDINVLMGGTLLKDVKNDKYAQRTVSGIFAGPTGAIADDLVQIVKMMASGHLNQNGVNKLARNIPFLQSWYLRGLSNKMIQSFGLPETYDKAINGA